MSPWQAIKDDLLDAFVAEATAAEPEILAWADGLVKSGSATAAIALAEGFKAKVPLAGGAIGAAITTAIGSMDATADADLKTLYDGVLAQAKARAKTT